MANKRTYINADEELIIQGKLTIEGEFEQRDLIKSSTLQIVEYDGEQLLVNGDGVDETGAAMPGSVVLRSGSSNVYLTYNEANATLAVVGANVSHSHNISAPLYTGNVTLTVPRNFTVSGDATTTSAQPFDASSDLNLPIVFNTVNTNVGEFGDASTVPTFTVNGKGLITAASENTISITSNNITDFVTAVRGNVSATDAGGDGSFVYNSGTGVFTYTGPSLAEVQTRIDNSAANVRAHISHLQSGGDGSLSYSSSTGVITYIGPDQTEANARIDAAPLNVRAHFSATSNIDYNSTTGVISQSLTTDDVTEGTNLYYTTARAQTDAQAVSINNVVEDTTPQLGGTLDINSQTIQGDLIPSANVTYDLGSNSARWQDVYLSGSTIYLDQHTLGIVNGELQFNNANVLISGASQVITGSQTFTGTVDLSGATVPGFTIDGELSVTGNVNSLNYVDLQVQNSEIILNSNVATATDAQIKVERGSTGTDTYIKWDEGSNRWQFSNDGSTDNDMLLFSDFSAVDSGGDGSFSYANGVFTYTGPSAAEVRAHFSGGDGITYTSGTGVIDVDSTVVRTSGAQSIAGEKTFTDQITLSADVLPSISNTYSIGSTTHHVNDIFANVIHAERLDLGDADISDIHNTFYAGEPTGTVILTRQGGGLFYKHTQPGEPNAGGYYYVDDSNVVTSTNNITIAGTKTFTGTMIVPDSSATANGAIYYDNATSKAYIYVGGSAQEITPATAVGTVEDVGTTGTNIYAGARTSGNVTYYGIKSVDAGSYLDISEASNVINIAGNVTQIRGAFTSSNGIDYNSSTGALSADIAEIRGFFSAADNGGDGSFGYNSSTGVFTYNGPSATEVRSHFSAGTGITLVNGVISSTGDNYGSWTLQTDSGGGSTDTITSGETVTIQGGTNITVTNVGNVITIRNDNAADIESVVAGSGLTGGGTSGAVTLNVGAGTGITVNADDIAVDMSAFSTTDLSEGTNLYHTTARANSAIDARVDKAFVDALNIGASSAVQAYVTEDNTNVSTQRLVFHGGDGSGNKALRHDDNLTYVPSTNTLSVGNIAVGGTITGASISATLINSGTLSSDRLPDLTVADFAGAAIQASSEAFSDSDTVLMTAAAVQDKIESYGYSTTTGDITGVTAGTGLSGGGTGGTVTLNVSGLTVSEFAGGAITTSAEAFADNDTTLMTSAAIADKIESYGFSTTTGDITGVTAGTNLNGGGTLGGVTLNLDTTLTGMTAATFSGTVTAGLFSGTATSARYADLAEKYESDSNYEAGTVVVFGGEKEITVTSQENDYRVAGVISTDPAYMMNSEADGQYVALRGRVPCKVIGPVKKGDVLVTSDRPGFAKASTDPHFVGASCVVGKALQNLESPSEGVIEVVV